jgi:hypothetical protein
MKLIGSDQIRAVYISFRMFNESWVSRGLRNALRPLDINEDEVRKSW